VQHLAGWRRRGKLIAMLVWAALAVTAIFAQPGSSDPTNELEAWHARFTKFPAIRIRWHDESVEHPLVSGVVDRFYAWPRGFRETVFAPGVTPPQVDVLSPYLPPDPWTPGVDAATTLGLGEPTFVQLRPSDNSFESSGGDWTLLRHPDLPLTSEWFVARMAAAGAYGEMKPEPPSGAGVAVFSTPGLRLTLVRQGDGLWSLKEAVQQIGNSLATRTFAFSDWRGDDAFGHIATMCTVSREDTRTGVRSGTRSKVLFAAPLNDLDVDTLAIDLKNSLTLDRARGIMLDSDGKVIGEFRSPSAANEFKRWLAVFVVGGGVAAVVFGWWWYRRKRARGAF